MSEIILNEQNINEEILNNNIKSDASYIINYNHNNYDNLKTFFKIINNKSNNIKIHLNLSSSSLIIDNLIYIFSDDISNLNINIDYQIQK